jgi:hypothetical protein
VRELVQEGGVACGGGGGVAGGVELSGEGGAFLLEFSEAVDEPGPQRRESRRSTVSKARGTESLTGALLSVYWSRGRLPCAPS